MSKHKHNYTQYSNKNQQNNQKAKTEENNHITEETLKPIATTVEINPVKETVETKTLPETVEGVVTGCAKLNVRAEANLFADVICTLDATSEIEINVEKSNKDWFYICTATGVEGYCMRKYVEAHL